MLRQDLTKLQFRPSRTTNYLAKTEGGVLGRNEVSARILVNGAPFRESEARYENIDFSYTYAVSSSSSSLLGCSHSQGVPSDRI